jgi:HlyD family secretion protein
MTKYESPEQIELRSEEVQEILGKPPKWIIRYGIMLIFGIVFLLFIGSYFFKYPDILPATIIVSTENLPAEIVAKTSGRIDTLFVQDKQTVEQGDALALIENPANYRDMLLLKQALERFQLNDSVHRFPVPEKTLQLGDIQQSYFSFLKAYEDYTFFYTHQYYRKRIQILQKQIATQQQMLGKTQRQLAIAAQQLQSAKQLFSIDSTLFEAKIVPLMDYEQAKSSFLQQQQAYESAKITLDNYRMGILQMEQSILELEEQEGEQKNNLQLSLSGAYDHLQTQITQWRQSYVLESAIGGIVTMTQYWQKNQNVKVGDVLLTVVPEEEVRIVGKILLPLQGAGKVKKGQRVNVKFANYPHLEYGMVRVEISNISLVPTLLNNEKGYMLEVSFPQGLVTNYGKELTFGQQMQGTAEIITDDLRLLDRFLNPIRSLWKR